MQTIIFMQVAIIIFENGIPLKMGLIALGWNSDLPVPVNTNEQINYVASFIPPYWGGVECPDCREQKMHEDE